MLQETRMQNLDLRSGAVLTMVAVLLLVVACNHEPTVSEIDYDGGKIFFITQADGGNTNTAALVGELQLNDGCFQIASDQIAGSRPVNIMWPEDFAVGVGGAEVEIHDASGRIVTRVGERTLLGGSGDGEDSERFGECEGAFWYAGEDVRAGDEIPSVFD